MDSAKKRAESEEEIEPPKNKGLKRNLSLVTLSLHGHLFDTKCFNNCIDICEKYGVQFRVTGWEIGNTNSDTTKVSIQMMTKDKNALNDAIEAIENTANNCGVEILQGEDDFEHG